LLWFAPFLCFFPSLRAGNRCCGIKGRSVLAHHRLLRLWSDDCDVTLHLRDWWRNMRRLASLLTAGPVVDTGNRHVWALGKGFEGSPLTK